MAGVSLKSTKDPGENFLAWLIFLSALSWSAETVRYCFSPRELTPAYCALDPESQKHLIAADTLWTTCAGAAGVCEKYLAPPARLPPMLYPPAALGRAPPVRFGLKVEANGALKVVARTADPTYDVGQLDLPEGDFTACEIGEEWMKRLMFALMVL